MRKSIPVLLFLWIAAAGFAQTPTATPQPRLPTPWGQYISSDESSVWIWAGRYCAGHDYAYYHLQGDEITVEVWPLDLSDTELAWMGIEYSSPPSEYLGMAWYFGYDYSYMVGASSFEITKYQSICDGGSYTGSPWATQILESVFPLVKNGIYVAQIAVTAESGSGWLDSIWYYVTFTVTDPDWTPTPTSVPPAATNTPIPTPTYTPNLTPQPTVTSTPTFGKLPQVWCEVASMNCDSPYWTQLKLGRYCDGNEYAYYHPNIYYLNIWVFDETLGHTYTQHLNLIYLNGTYWDVSICDGGIASGTPYAGINAKVTDNQIAGHIYNVRCNAVPYNYTWNDPADTYDFYYTFCPADTPTPTETPVYTFTPTNTPTETPIPTNTATPTETPTGTIPPTPTSTNTPTPRSMGIYTKYQGALYYFVCDWRYP